MTIALGDGVGQVGVLEDGTRALEVLSTVAREAGGIRLVLGWMPVAPDGLDPTAFVDVVVIMPGWGNRTVLRSPNARFIPTSLAGIGALLAGPLRPDVLLTRLVRRDGQLRFGTEVSWQADLLDAGLPTIAIVDDQAPCADGTATFNDAHVHVAAHCADGSTELPGKEPEPVHEALAESVLRLVPENARLQYGPGQLGTALLRRADRPLRIDTGLLTDAVVDLDRRGWLVGEPSATYLLGSEKLYKWADGRPILRGLGYTHDVTRLSHGEPFIAVNTAVEIDPVGQVNVEGIGEKVIGGIGGHFDYCVAARMSVGGLSIIAVPTTVNGTSPLVERLSRPVSTPAHAVDVVVTERDYADLRGADWAARRRLISALFAA
ncbi:MAG: acetyl-CoA hydrolase [Mycobacteriaceae bacterium]|nr:acetyl-CoA hydrolase [Mycobacteriaceae bacterium]